MTEIFDDQAIASPTESLGDFLISEAPVSSLTIAPSKLEQIAHSYPYLMGDIGGTTIPDWRESVFRELFSGPTEAFRILGTSYAPQFGVLVDAFGRAPKIPAKEALFSYPSLVGLPDIKPTETLRNPAFITMPWGGLHNYGHFVLDCLTGVEVALQLGCDRRFIFPPLKAWHRDHLRLMGIKWDELRGDWYLVKDAIYTSCMSEFLHAPNRVYADVAARQLAKIPNFDNPGTKLYISRRHLEKRPCPDEDALEKQLERRGFVVVMPERLPITKQIQLFHSATIVAGLSGAAFANAIYCRPCTKIIEIQPELARGIWVRNICAMVGLKWSPYFCESEQNSIPKIGGVERPEVGITTRFDVQDTLNFIINT